MTRCDGVLALVLAAMVSGCSLFHHGETPQQKFLDALNRGNSPEASQIWLTMSPDDRNRWRRGEGLSPAVPPDQAMKMLNEQGVATDQGQVNFGPNGAAGLLSLPAAAAAAPDSPPASDAR